MQKDMAALDTGCVAWGPQYSTPALHAELFSLGNPGDLILPAYTPSSSRRPRRRQARVERSWPMTFHEGLLTAESGNETLESYLDLLTFDTPAASAQNPGPTIASIKCGADATTPHLYSEHDQSPPTPELRIDTACTAVPASSSPLALVSNFLDTVAGMIKTPCPASLPHESERDEDAIMIFGSEVFIDVYPEQRHSWFEDTNAMTPSAWECLPADWQFIMPSSTAHPSPMELSNGLDSLATAEHSRDSMDMASVVCC